MDLHTTCKEYDLCTPETRAELAANGFDFSVCKFGITEFIAARMKMGFIVETKGVIPYPTFTEVWRALPSVMIREKTYNYFLDLQNKRISYREPYDNEILVDYAPELDEEYIMYEVIILGNNITEAACQLWIKLKKGGFLNG